MNKDILIRFFRCIFIKHNAVLIILLIMVHPASAATVNYILHEGNNYSVEIEPDVVVSRAGGQQGPISIVGGFWVAEFEDPVEGLIEVEFEQIGGTRSRAPEFVVMTSFTLDTVADASDNSYETLFFFWSRQGDSIVGTGFEDFDFSPYTNPGAAFQLRIAAVPVPAGIWLFASGCLGLLWGKRKSASV